MQPARRTRSAAIAGPLRAFATATREASVGGFVGEVGRIDVDGASAERQGVDVSGGVIWTRGVWFV